MDLFPDLKAELRPKLITAKCSDEKSKSHIKEGGETEQKNVKSESEPIPEVTAKKVRKNILVTLVGLPWS